MNTGTKTDEEALAWRPSSTWKPLQANEVHLWRLPHASDAGELARYQQILSAGEQEQAARFRAQRSRDEFIQTRACVRLLLARYSAIPPASLRFSAGPFGKPALMDVPLSFNVSHTDGVSMIAVALHMAVGVDVERVQPSLDLLAIAADHFSHNELAKLRSVSGADLTESFFRCWTRKEAFLKAQGLGLPHGLDAFEVTLLPQEAPAVLACTWLPDAPHRWTITHFEPLPGICGALAVEAPIAKAAGSVVTANSRVTARRVAAQPGEEPTPRIVPLDWSIDLLT